MALTINSEAGSASANSFIDRDTAQLYFDGRLYSDAWTNASAEDKDKSLVSATNRLNQERWVGMPTEINSQSLSWPRYGVANADYDSGRERGTGWESGLTFDAAWLNSATIPVWLENATCELALVLLDENRLQDTGLELIDQVGVGDLNVTPSKTRRAGRLPEHCMRFIRPYLVGGGGMVPLVRS